jgi:hypothetical protein
MKQRAQKCILAITCTSAAVALGVAGLLVHASDHDDGSQSTSTNNLNLTDLFAFREDNQTGQAGDAGNLILVMDSNGHTPAGQQAFFNTGAYYDFHVTRVSAADMNKPPTGNDDVILRFKFGDPDANQHQPITMSVIRNGQTITANGAQAQTTSLKDGQAGALNINQMQLANSQITVFAGMREDPFYFDVGQFFKVRAGALGTGPSANFLPPEQAVDGFARQNVNSIVVRVPISFLQTAAGEPVFDFWETTTTIANSKQIDRLARPAINEGLSVTDGSLNAFNSIPPSQDLSPQAAPVLAEDTKTLVAFANLGKALGTTPAPAATTIAGAFLPDVMRLDTRLSLPPGKTAYNGGTSGSLGILTGGRKIQDDVIDITLSFLVAGDPSGNTVKDNVNYLGVPGNPNQPGHKLLVGQSSITGPATYPFVTTPN